MEQIQTVRSLVGHWPSRQIFAEDCGVAVGLVHKWIAANSIPSRYQRSVLDAALVRTVPITAELLIDIHARHEPRSGVA